jgi:hypothetical protein
MSEIQSERKEELAVNLGKVEEKISRALEESTRARQDLTLIVVTKTFPAEDALLLYELGVRNFGENRDDEGSKKNQIIPPDAIWHFQGKVQSRKIPSISDWADVIHSLDSLEHAAKFATQPSVMSQQFFLQINLEPEAEHRGGISQAKIPEFLERTPMDIYGLMLVAPLSMDPTEAFEEISTLRGQYGLQGLSMGMSGDFEAAVKAGATHIRVGSSILGSRPSPA